MEPRWQPDLNTFAITFEGRIQISMPQTRYTVSQTPPTEKTPSYHIDDVTLREIPENARAVRAHLDRLEAGGPGQDPERVPWQGLPR